jgi:hypothetical protein
LTNKNQDQYRAHCREPLTHVKTPSYAFRATIESKRKVGVMAVFWVKLPPDIEKLARVVPWWV